MEPYRLAPQPGSSLDPANILGRDDTILLALQELRIGNNLLLNDPRRMGKTALLDRLCNEPGEHMLAVKIDYEGANSVEEFLLRTVRALSSHSGVWKRAADVARNFFGGLEAEGGGVTIKAAFSHKAPEALLLELIESIDARFDDGDLLVVAMDELPVAIDNIATNEGAGPAHQLLQTLRRLRRNHDSSLRWIVSGSIGFHHVLRRCNATEGVVNDLINLPLGPLESGDARYLAACLLLGIDRIPDTGALDAMVESSGAIPFLIHQLAHLLRHGESSVTVSDVERAFDAFVDDRDQSRAVTHLLTRLDPNYGDLAGVAATILDAAANPLPISHEDVEESVSASTITSDQLLDVLNDLVDDHYLVRTSDGTWTWRYDVLRRIWHRRRNLTA